MIFLSTLILLFAQLVRSFRYWLIVADPSVSIRKILLVFLASSALGFWLPIALTEPIRVVLLLLLGKSAGNTLVSYTFHRALDGIVIVGTSIFLLFLPTMQEHVSEILIVQLFLIGLTSIGLLSFVISLPRLVELLQLTLIQRKTFLFSRKITVALSKTADASQRIASNSRSSLLFLVTLTAFAWLMDIFSAYLISEHPSILETAASWIFGGAMSLFAGGDERFGSTPFLRVAMNFDVLVYAHFAFCGLILLTYWPRKWSRSE